MRKDIAKQSRYTMGEKIDTAFLETITLLFSASRCIRIQKLPVLQKAASTLDLLKFFLQIAWEIKVLDNKKYIALSHPLDEIGKMLGGWIRGMQKETPTLCQRMP